MEELKLSYQEIIDEIHHFDYLHSLENSIENAVEKVFQNLSVKRNIPTSAAPVIPNWFTPVVQDFVSNLWNKEDSASTGLRMAAVKYMQEEASKAKQHLFIHDAIKLIKYITRPIEND